MFCIFYILTNSATICKIKKKIPDQSKEKVARRVRYSTKKLVIYESLYALVYFCEILLVQIDTILLIFLRIFTYQKIASALIILSPPPAWIQSPLEYFYIQRSRKCLYTPRSLSELSQLK